MDEEKDLDRREKELLKARSGWREDSPQYAECTAKLNQLERKRKRISGGREGKEKWKMFYLSQVTPLVALAISVFALIKSCAV